MMTMDDENSVLTPVMRNTATTGLTPRQKMVRKTLLAVAVLAVAYMCLGKSQKAPLFGSLEPTSRSLYTPYDTSTDVVLPAWTDSLADVWEPMAPTDTPLFWFLPKAGGAIIVRTFSYCLGLVLASNKGTNTGVHPIGVYQAGRFSPYPYFPNYVNVKTQSEIWIRRCARRGLLESGLADVVSVQHMTYSMENLFSTSYRARGFVMFRHPVKRIVDQFYYRQHATWERSYDADLAIMTLEDFATSDKMVENMYVRELNQLTSTIDVTEGHINLAKEILRRKFLVAITEWFDVGLVRYEKYFGWWDQHNVLGNLTINNCHYRIIEGGDTVGNYPKVPNTEDVYSTIATRNWADLELYHYAKTLFAEQAKLL